MHASVLAEHVITRSPVRQVFDSQAQLVRRTTDQMVNEINNNATIVLQNATSAADMVVKIAQVC